jgi:hypothetical protein
MSGPGDKFDFTRLILEVKSNILLYFLMQYLLLCVNGHKTDRKENEDGVPLARSTGTDKYNPGIDSSQIAPRPAPPADATV